MTTSSADPTKIAEFSRMVEGGGLESSLRAFMDSLSLRPDERGEVARSIAALPDSRVSVLPGKPPGVVKDGDFWM